MRTNLRPLDYNCLIISLGSGTSDTIIHFLSFIYLKKN
nr:MAG TPA: hypothetical protein [Caudoviricetes sp.]